jgi:hypothetical protein
MRNNDGMADLIASLEAIVGQYYHNEQKRGGFFFRYPIRITRNGIDYEVKGDGKIPNLTAEELETIHYKTGANSLYIGSALYHVLEFLENRYKGKLDFTELELEYQLNQMGSPWSFFDDILGVGEDDEDEDDE